MDNQGDMGDQGDIGDSTPNDLGEYDGGLTAQEYYALLVMAAEDEEEEMAANGELDQASAESGNGAMTQEQLFRQLFQG
jgi:hypothetical protein